ncbi:GerAB/ArcD/ProY family transporter [Tepidibacter hydrothermalis]|uniref:Endospore germination permease n=1 Tax=Tepidibacter hydrothermalis TaxID=3036126 RepID=A0ABY8EFM7_9FIRM|nr:endospore germination permease [Tepidibacter hydrothermalis]WFD09645.1 endospore germination permease [Tepidibacter hydrothermalis]
MIENGKISHNQFKLLVILCYIGTSILLTPATLASEAKQDAWIACILGLLIGLLLVMLYNSLANNLYNMTLVEYCEKVLGKWIGKLISLLFILFLFINCSTLVYVLGNFVTTQIMPETPIQFNNILFVIVVIIGTRLGLESFARASEILYPWVLGLFIILIVLLCKDINFENLQPVFEYGGKPIIKGSLLYVSYSSLTLIPLMMIFPAYVKNTEEAKKSFLSGTLIGGIIILIITLLSILVLGSNITARNAFPAYILAKKINIGNFLERLEPIITILWFITVFYKSILYFYGAVLGLSQILKLKDYRTLTLPLGMILVVLSLIVYPNSTYADEWNTTTWLSFSLTYGFFLPLLLLIIGNLRKNKSKI